MTDETLKIPDDLLQAYRATQMILADPESDEPWVALCQQYIERIGRIENERDAALHREAELKDQIAEAEDWLPGECPGYQTLGERTKLLKDQMEFASEMCAELREKLEGK